MIDSPDNRQYSQITFHNWTDNKDKYKYKQFSLYSTVKQLLYNEKI